MAPWAQAILATDANSAVSIYLNKNSRFSSGQVSRSELESKQISSETEVSYDATWDHKNYTLQADQILRDIQVARFVVTTQKTSLYSLNRSDSSVIKNWPAEKELEITAVDDLWARVKDKDSNLQGWLPLNSVQSTHTDPGVFVNLIDTYIRKSPDNQSDVLTTLPRHRRVIPLEISKQFIKINYENQTGYVDITHFISRADFASLAFVPGKNWVTVRYRNNDSIITQFGDAVLLKDVLGYVTNPRRGVVKNAETSYGPPLRARVDILKQEAHVWAQSQIAGHGQVWWKKQELILNTEKPASEATLTTEELLTREIYSIAFENKNSVRGVVSSNGVYRTDDGKIWTLLPQFEKNNYPVSIHPNGTWFVGSYKSRNRGKSFEPFIRWDKIANAIEATHFRNPRYMKLTQIEALPDSKILIHVDTGNRKVKLRSLIGDLNWDVIKN